MPVGYVDCIKCGHPTSTLLCTDCMEKESKYLEEKYARNKALENQNFPKCSKCGEESWHEPCDMCFIKEEEKMAESKEQVNHPKHYNHGKFEVIDVIEDWELDFHIGNVVKYVSRAGRKSDDTEIQDLKKALWYLKRRIEILEKKDV
jgi:hypothetical protein